MINSNYNGQFVDGNQNTLSGKSELQTALDSVQGSGGGGGGVLQQNIDGNLLYTGINFINPINPQDVATKNYVDLQIGGGGSQIVNGLNPNSKLVADLVELKNGQTPLNMNLQQIKNTQDPSSLQDVSTKNYTDLQVATKQSQAQADLRYYQNTVPLNSIALASGDLNMNSNKITNMNEPLSLSDASTKNYTDSQVATKQSQAQADLRYYQNTVPLNSIAPASGDLNMNSNKITNVLAGSTTSDAYQYGQAQTALNLKSDRTQSLQSLNLQQPLATNLDLDTGFKTLVRTADDTNTKEVINKEYFDSHLFQTEHLYFISNNTIPVTSSQITGFVVKTQQPSSGSVNIVVGSNQVTLKANQTYNIFVRAFFSGNNNNSNIRLQLWSGGSILDASYPSACELNSYPPTSNSQTIQGSSINYTFKPVIDTTVILQCITATGLVSPCDIEWTIKQMPVNYTVISQIAQTTPPEFFSAQTTQNVPANTNFSNGNWTTRDFSTCISSISYNSSTGVLTLQPNTYTMFLDGMLADGGANKSCWFYLADTGNSNLNLLVNSLSFPANTGVLYVQNSFSLQIYGGNCLTVTFKLTSVKTVQMRCILQQNPGTFYLNFRLEVVTPFSSAVNTSSNLSINSDIQMGNTYKIQQQTVPFGPYDLVNKIYSDLTYLQYTSTVNQMALPTANFDLNNKKIINLAPATLGSDAVRLDQISVLSGVTNPMTGNLNANNFKIINLQNGTSANDCVNLIQSQSFNNGYLAKQIYNQLNNTDKLHFSNNKLIWEDSIQNTTTNPYLFLTKAGTSTILIPDANILQDGAIEFQSDNINTPILTLNKTQTKTIFQNYPVEIRNNTTQPSSGSGSLLRVGLPYFGSFSATFDGSIQCNGVAIPTPCSKNWKSNIQEVTCLKWVDDMKIYSFEYDEKKLADYNIDPNCLPTRHIRCGVMMEEIDQSYYIPTQKDSSWGGNSVIDRQQVDQLMIARHQQRINEQQQQIADLTTRLAICEQKISLQNQVQSLNMNPFVVDQLSSDEEQQPIILDPSDVPKKNQLFKSIF